MTIRTGVSRGGVLFLGHNAHRTGAPLMLLHLLQWLKKHSDLPFSLLLLGEGELVDQFAEICPTKVVRQGVLTPAREELSDKFRRKLTPRSSLRTAVLQEYPPVDYPVVYSNTITNGEWTQLFGAEGRVVITHVHEMKAAIKRWAGPHLEAGLRATRQIIAASEAVRRDVLDVPGASDDRIAVVHEFGQPHRHTLAELSAYRSTTRASLGISTQEVVIGLCGTIDWRKGGDLLPQIVQALQRRCPQPWRFVWIGASPHLPDYHEVEHDLRILGLSHRVILVPPTPEPYRYFAALDVFLLTSREDPFPLVLLENASLGTPLVCFGSAGGAAELVESDAGIVVPYLDVVAVAEALATLILQAPLRESLGRNAAQKVAERFSIDRQATRILGLIEQALRPEDVPVATR